MKKSKKELLIDAVGPIGDYIDTGWRFPHNPPPKIELRWDYKWTKYIHAHPRTMTNIPPTRSVCHCTTRIVWNCLIQHKITKEYVFVGSRCIKYFGEHKKTCVKCFKANPKHSTHCDKCRVKCEVCKVHHDDNSICKLFGPEKAPVGWRQCKEESDSEEEDRSATQRVRPKRSYTMIDGDRSYTRTFGGNPQNVVVSKLDEFKKLSETTLGFGKYSDNLLGEIPESYIRWMRKQEIDSWNANRLYRYLELRDELN